MNKKFFFFDIDGTLAVGTPGRQYIPESTKKAICLLKEQGHFVAIATGRSYAMAVDHMRSLGFENMVSDGGNGITIDNELITIKPLDYQKCLNLIDECKEKGFISTNVLVELQGMIEHNKAGVRKNPGTKLVDSKTGKVIYTPPQEEKEIRDLLSNF